MTGFWDFYGTRRRGDFFSEKHSEALAAATLRVRRPRLLVDVGCGTGAFVSELSRRGIETIGVDGSAAALELAASTSRARGPVPRFLIGDVNALPLRDSEADFVTMIEVIEHLDDGALRDALSEARRILAVGSTLLITTPNAEDLSASTVQCPDCGAQFHVMQHVRQWTPRGLQDLLETHGFEDVHVRPVRFVENGPLLERAVRSVVYRLRPQRPRLLAIARRS